MWGSCFAEGSVAPHHADMLHPRHTHIPPPHTHTTLNPRHSTPLHSTPLLQLNSTNHNSPGGSTWASAAWRTSRRSRPWTAWPRRTLRRPGRRRGRSVLDVEVMVTTTDGVGVCLWDDVFPLVRRQRARPSTALCAARCLPRRACISLIAPTPPLAPQLFELTSEMAAPIFSWVGVKGGGWMMVVGGAAWVCLARGRSSRAISGVLSARTGFLPAASDPCRREDPLEAVSGASGAVSEQLASA